MIVPAELAMDIVMGLPQELRESFRNVLEAALQDYGKQEAAKALRTFAQGIEQGADYVYNEALPKPLETPGRNEEMVRAGDLYSVVSHLLEAAEAYK